MGAVGGADGRQLPAVAGRDLTLRRPRAVDPLGDRAPRHVEHAAVAVQQPHAVGLGEQGALPTLFAATEDLPGAAYVGPDGFQEGRGHPTLVGRSRAASDVDTARGLWELSERLTGVTTPDLARA